MSTSSNCGFKARPAVEVLDPSGVVRGARRPRTAASVSVTPACRVGPFAYAAEPLAFASVTVGVGQRCMTASESWPRRCPGFADDLKSGAHGVGHREDEDPVSAVGSAGISRLQTTPLRIEPQRGQVGEDEIEAANKES
jgi:hypothetical protein